MIFVIGSKGRIGSNISSELKRLNMPFTGITRNGCATTKSFRDFLNEVITYKEGTIINASTISLEKLHELTKRISKGVKLIHISSVAVYGNTVLENQINPINDYGRIKYQQEKIVLEHKNYVIIRLSNVYGGSPETSRVLSRFIEGNLDYIEVDKNGNDLIRDYVSISNLIGCIMASMNYRNNCIINVSSGRGISLSQLFSIQNLSLPEVKKVVCADDTILVSIIKPDFVKNITLD